MKVKMRHVTTLLRVCGLSIAGGMLVVSFAAVRQIDDTMRPLPTYDIRTLVPVQPQLRSQITRLRERPDPSVHRAGDAIPMARTYLRNALQQHDIDDQMMRNLHLVGEDSSGRSGLTHVHFQQLYDGVEVFQCGVSVHLNAHGQVFALNGSVATDLTVSTVPGISREEAMRIATDHLGMSGEGAEPPGELVVFPRAGATTRLGWRIALHKRVGEWYDMVVDAHSGEVLYRVNLYKFIEGLVFNPHPDSGNRVMRSFDGDDQASPEGWVRGTLTRGNNVVTREDIGGDDEIFPGQFARAVDGMFEFPFSDSYAQATPNVHDSNEFDLDQTTLRFTPRGESYVVEQAPLDIARSFGDQIDLNNDNAFEVTFERGFTFPFFGTAYRSLFVNSNGNLTLGFGDGDPDPSAAKFAVQFPRIAPLWIQLDVETGGGVFFRQNEQKMVVTWNQVSQPDDLALSTFQVTLYATGIIEFAYDGIASDAGLVGISPGGVVGSLSSNVDFTRDSPIDTVAAEPVLEHFPTDVTRVAEYFQALPDQMAAITNAFYWVNLMHDYLYDLGFTEEAGNFQEDNFDKGGIGGDRVNVDVQDGGFFNNAAIGVPTEGNAPRMALGLFRTPIRDTAFDGDVIIHEYAHGLTERLVGGPFMGGCLNGFQSGSLSEGWSDFYAISITEEPLVGEYVMNDADRGIRRVAFDRNALRYGDFGNLPSRFGRPIRGGIGEIYLPEIHNDGEIWATVLWDLRNELGKARTELIVTEALKLTPCHPTMFDARDAILLADEGINDGANADAIWDVFALRGLGASASVSYRAETQPDDMTSVFQAFDIPGDTISVGPVVFRETFDSGIRRRGWTIEGEGVDGGNALWHRSTLQAARGTHSIYYGLEDGGSYDTGARNFGALTSPDIDLAGLTGAILEFDHILEAERGFPFDPAVVRVSADGEAFEQIAFLFDDTGPQFQRARFDLSRFADQQIRVQFYFDTLDGDTNGFGGWWIDNVIVRELR